MKPKTKKLTVIALSVGLLGLCLRLLLYRIGFDEKNILSSSHPLHLACLALTVLAAVYLAVSLVSPRGGKVTAGTSPRAPFGCPVLLAAAAFTLLHGLELTRKSGDLLDTARMVLAFLGAGSMALLALTGRNRRPRTVALGMISVFYALDMFCRYPDWSGNPQLPDYVFQVFACVLLALTGYHRLAFHVGLSKGRMLQFCSLMSLVLCLFCAAGPDTRAFYLGSACWAAVCICVPELPAQSCPHKQDPDDDE
jgi:hypothetical protein